MGRIAKLQHLAPHERQAVTRFVERLRQTLDENLLAVHLFGSKARGDSEAESDIDLFVLLGRKDLRALDQITEAATESNLAFDTVLSAMVYTEQEYEANRRCQTLFAQDLEREGVVLYDRGSEVSGPLSTRPRPKASAAR